MTDHLRTLSARARAVVACHDAFLAAPGLRPVRSEDAQLETEIDRLRDALRDFDADSEMTRSYGAPPSLKPATERIAEINEKLAALMVGLVADTRPRSMPELHDARLAVEDAKPLMSELHELLGELEAVGEPVNRGRWRMPRKS